MPRNLARALDLARRLPAIFPGLRSLSLAGKYDERALRAVLPSHISLSRT
ncbi:hypothetical protein [Streptomyces sp. NPDC048269]